MPSEHFAILDPRLVSGRIADLRLFLPSAHLCERGRVFLDAQADGESVNISFYARANKAVSSLIATASGNLGTLTINAANGSGVRGSLSLLSLEGFECDAFVNFSFLDQLGQREGGIRKLFDAEGNIEGKAGFDAFLGPVRDEILAMVSKRFVAKYGYERLCQPIALAIANPEELELLCSWMALGRFHQWHDGDADISTNFKAQRYWWNAFALFEHATLAIRPYPKRTTTLNLPLNHYTLTRG